MNVDVKGLRAKEYFDDRATKEMAEHLKGRGFDWLHVDYRPELDPFYRGCGFAPSTAGLIRL